MDYFNINLDRSAVCGQSALALAHLGDAVYELMVRTKICSAHALTNRSMHKETLRYVNAIAQSEAYLLIKDSLTSDEDAIFLRGRNSHINTVPKNADLGKYHAATGLESLFGFLWLTGDHARLNELFDIIIDKY